MQDTEDWILNGIFIQNPKSIPWIQVVSVSALRYKIFSISLRRTVNKRLG